MGLIKISSCDWKPERLLAPDDEHYGDEMRGCYPDIKTNYEEVKEGSRKVREDIKIYPVKNFTRRLLKNL